MVEVEPGKEIKDDLKREGYPPSPRSETPFSEDDFNFKKYIITPQEPVEFIKDETTGQVYELPKYTATMALGNLTSGEVSAMRDDFSIIRILNRYGYYTLAKAHYYKITDRILASQSHQGKAFAGVTVLQYGMRRIEENISTEGEDETRNPFTKVIEGIKGAPAKVKGNIVKEQARY